MSGAILVFGLASIIILSFGFLVAALYLNRRWTKEYGLSEPPERGKDETR